MTKPGHYFAGWHDLDGSNSDYDGDAWDFSQTVDYDMTLYALWEPNQYTVTFIANLGTPAPANQQVLYNGLVTRPAPMTRPDGSDNSFVFRGWFTNPGFTGSEWNFNSNRVSSDLILFAKWESIPFFYTVKFDTKVIGETIPDQLVVAGTLVTEPQSVNNPGNGFRGWFLEADYNTSNWTSPWIFSREPVTSARVVSNIMTLCAKWEPIYYEVSFQYNEGDPFPATQQVAPGGKVREPLPMTRPDHYFGGWYVSPAFLGNPWNFATGTITDEITNGFSSGDEMLVLHAKWTRNDIPPTEIVQQVRIHGVWYIDFAGSSVIYNGGPGLGASTDLTVEQRNGNDSSILAVIKNMDPKYTLQLSGHANPTVPRPGEPGFNQGLWDTELADLERISRLRAIAVIEEIKRKDVPTTIQDDKMINIGYSDKLYGDGSHGSLNRTVELIIIEILPVRP